MRRSGLFVGLLLCVGALASCAPQLTPNQTAPTALKLDPYGAALSIGAGTDAGSPYQVVRFTSGTLEATPRVTLYAAPGRAVAVNSGLCTPQGVNVVCRLPKLRARDAYLIPARNVARASAEALRPDGVLYAVNMP